MQQKNGSVTTDMFREQATHGIYQGLLDYFNAAEQLIQKKTFLRYEEGHFSLLFRFYNDCYRTIIDKFDIHHCAENACFNI